MFKSSLSRSKVGRYKRIAAKVLKLEDKYSKFTDDEIKKETSRLKAQLQAGKTIDQIKVDAFCLVREAAHRTLNMKHFEVQIIGGLVLLDRRIAEMKTGEGKTLTLTLPVFTRALEGKGVHVITVNEYLAKRDYEQMDKLYSFLGLTVGLNLADLNADGKKKAYAADITYGVSNEFGFDYLRDNHVYDLTQRVQRPFHYAVVDEIDSILIDEARTPLILASLSFQDQSLYIRANAAVKKLREDTHFTFAEESHSAYFTNAGVEQLEKAFHIDNIYDLKHRHLMRHLQNSLKAWALFKKDVHYIIDDGKVELIDQNTGRVMKGRTLSDGLHQAIEAKEQLQITNENKSQSLVTLQNFFQMYPVLAGLTGTASTEKKEFYDLYRVDVVSIPTNKPVIRKDQRDEIYMTKDQQYKAIVRKVEEVYPTGRPILIGTPTIQKSFEIAEYLNETDIPFEVLNAHTVEHEVKIIQRAGRFGQVLIATNMAGRGTDIVVDEEALEEGGLFVIGTERHGSRRIDNQLVGRSGRQGEPGESQFIISLDDELFENVEEEKMVKIKKKIKTNEYGKITTPLIHKFTQQQQLVSESLNYTGREYMMKFNSVMNEQRETVYEVREKLLHMENPKDFILSCMEDSINEFKRKEELEQEQLLMNDKQLAFLVAVSNEPDTLQIEPDSYSQLKLQMLFYLDSMWTDLILQMELLRDGIFNNSYAQLDPVRSYQLEGFDIFKKFFEEFYKKVGELLYIHINGTEDDEEKEEAAS